MSKEGMGVIYKRTAFGSKLKRALLPQEIRDMLSRYETHHLKLTNEVKKELYAYGKALIIDCHSFPSQPLPCDKDQSIPRPDFCIGTDSFHTPKRLSRAIVLSIKKMGYNVRINRPYAGTIVPIEFYKRDNRVESIMIEVNRSLYMNEADGTKTRRFNLIQAQIQSLLNFIRGLE